MKDLELLYSPIDDIFDSVSKVISNELDSVGHFSFNPYTFTLFPSILDQIIFPDYEPKIKYPVANCYIEENGTWVLEIGVSGFSKEDLNIKREGNVIIVEGSHDKNQDENTEKDKKKYLYRKLAKRDFIVAYEMSNKLDFSKINTSLKDGILNISIPLKDQERMMSEKIKIS